MSNRIIIGFVVLFVAVCGGLGFMIVKSAKREAPVATNAAKDEVKAVVEAVKPVQEVAKVVEPKPKAKPVELTFTEATKLAIALLKKNADAEWVEAMRKFTYSEKLEMSRFTGTGQGGEIGRTGAEPMGGVLDAIVTGQGRNLRSVGLPHSALYAVGTCALKDPAMKSLFEIAWNKHPDLRSVERLADSAGRVSGMTREFMELAYMIHKGDFSPARLTGEERKNIEHVFGVETSTFVR